MKDDKHPPYQQVLFVDSTAGAKFLCGSTVTSDKKEMFEGKEYPVVHISISSASHPFYNKDKTFMDTEGQVSKFMKRYARKKVEEPAKE
jgi:large subunit ribosomal protein L31